TRANHGNDRVAAEVARDELRAREVRPAGAAGRVDAVAEAALCGEDVAAFRDELLGIGLLARRLRNRRRGGAVGAPAGRLRMQGRRGTEQRDAAGDDESLHASSPFARSSSWPGL